MDKIIPTFLIYLSAHFFLTELTAGLVGLSTSTRTPDLHLRKTGGLTSTTGGLLLFDKTSLDKAVGWFDLGEGILVLVDKTKASGVATTKAGLETEDNNKVLLGVHFLGDLIFDFVTGWSAVTWVEHVNNELLAVKELVVEAPADTKSNLRNHG